MNTSKLNMAHWLSIKNAVRSHVKELEKTALRYSERKDPVVCNAINAEKERTAYALGVLETEIDAEFKESK